MLLLFFFFFTCSWRACRILLLSVFHLFPLLLPPFCMLDYTSLAHKMRKKTFVRNYLGFWNDPHKIRLRMSNLFSVCLSTNVSCMLVFSTVSTLWALPFELWGSCLTSTHPSIHPCPWAKDIPAQRLLREVWGCHLV